MDATLIDRAKQINLIDLAERALGAPVRKSGKWLQWPCPFHADSKSPSFSINKENNSWRCFGCNQGGDSIKFVMLYEKLEFRQAVERLTGGSFAPAQQAARPTVKPTDYQQWETQARKTLRMAEAALWGPIGERALAYLRTERCLTDETIREAHLGYLPADGYSTRKLFGMPGEGSFWLPRGIVIPYISQGKLWSINIRRPTGIPKYFKLTGSRPAILNYDALHGACLAVFTEGEFDALLLYQDCPESTAVTLGGAAVSKVDLGQWGQNLYSIETLYLASDTDAAGLSLAAGLGDFSRRFIRLALPSGKDITEYRRSGGDLAKWFMEAI